MSASRPRPFRDEKGKGTPNKRQKKKNVPSARGTDAEGLRALVHDGEGALAARDGLHCRHVGGPARVRPFPVGSSGAVRRTAHAVDLDLLVPGALEVVHGYRPPAAGLNEFFVVAIQGHGHVALVVGCVRRDNLAVDVVVLVAAEAGRGEGGGRGRGGRWMSTIWRPRHVYDVMNS